MKEKLSEKKVEELVRLVKKGDGVSLRRLRNDLTKSRNEIASRLGVTEQELAGWESGKVQPSSKQLIRWKLELSSYIDDVIKSWLGTDDADIVANFWKLIWGLMD